MVLFEFFNNASDSNNDTIDDILNPTFSTPDSNIKPSEFIKQLVKFAISLDDFRFVVGSTRFTDHFTQNTVTRLFTDHLPFILNVVKDTVINTGDVVVFANDSSSEESLSTHTSQDGVKHVPCTFMFRKTCTEFTTCVQRVAEIINKSLDSKYIQHVAETKNKSLDSKDILELSGGRVYVDKQAVQAVQPVQLNSLNRLYRTKQRGHAKQVEHAEQDKQDKQDKQATTPANKIDNKQWAESYINAYYIEPTPQCEKKKVLGIDNNLIPVVYEHMPDLQTDSDSFKTVLHNVYI